MKKILIRKRSIICIILVISISFRSFCQKQISLADVSKHVGEVVNLCGKVYEASLLSNVKGKPTLMNLGGIDPKERIEVRIKFEDRANFNYNPEALFLYKNVCLTGKITKDHGYAEMVIDRLNTSKLINDAFASTKDTTEQVVASSKNDSENKPQDKIIRTFSNAYLLTGPRLNERIITWLKGGSSVLIDYSSRGWSYVRVIENISSPNNSPWLYGFVRNQALGLTKRRK